MALRDEMDIMTFSQQLRILDVVDQVRQEVGGHATMESIIDEVDAVEAAEAATWAEAEREDDALYA